MAEERVQRRLAAILAADVVGYSRLMGVDEAGTRARFNAHLHELIEPAIANRSGRIVKTTGDGMLVEFASVVDAVQCAVEIQKGIAERNADEPDDRRMEFRVGVNLGDVIIEGDDIHGNGVNVAARLEGLAEPGGICISGIVYDQIESILSLGYNDLGEQQVKNIAKPVRSYSIRLQSSETTAVETAPETVPPDEPSRPSVAVLPFTNMSADSEQEFFADGISEDIITSLSKISGLFVIARNSSFAYKGKAVDLRQVGRDLGVRTVLEGSIRKAGNKVRITAQLIDVTTGGHVWSARFDRDLTDLFALQDEITSNVVSALQVRLVEGEQARVWSRSTENLGAWECLTQGLPYFRRYTREDNVRARSLFEKAVELDPGYVTAWIWIGWTHWADARFLWVDAPSEAAGRANELAQKGLTLDEGLSETHALLSAVHLMHREFDDAIAQGEKAVALDPNGADITALLAMTLNWSGRPKEAEALVEKAKRMSPLYSAWYLAVQAHAYRLMARHDEAIAIYGESVARNPDHIGPRIGLTSCLAEVGRLDEARSEAAEVLRINPSFTLTKYAESLTYKDPKHAERSLKALREAGLPD